MKSDQAEKYDRALVIFSGGQDSTYCLFWALENYSKVHAITFDYGQRHSAELEAAKAVFARAAKQYPDKIGNHMLLGFEAFGLERTTQPSGYDFLKNPKVLEGTSPLVSDAPLEQYADSKSLPGGLEKTFVPMRNQFFMTIAANRAFVMDCGVLVTGVCQEDNGGYPDCTDTFIAYLQATCSTGTFTEEAGFSEGLRIDTPLMYLTKAETVHAAMAISGCYEATAWSHTSYDGKYPPTGHDHATLLRAKGFEEANVPDPLIMRANYENLMRLPKTANYELDCINLTQVQKLLTELVNHDLEHLG